MNRPSVERNSAETILNRAYPRMVRISIVLVLVGALLAAFLFGTAAAVGFLAGGLVTILNFVWLHRAVDVLMNRMLRVGAGGSRFRMTLGFLGRYALVAAIAYAIFRSSSQAFGAFLVALPLPVLAAMCEAAYEAFLNIKDPDSANT